jgi:hypothetical protein
MIKPGSYRGVCASHGRHARTFVALASGFVSFTLRRGQAITLVSEIALKTQDGLLLPHNLAIALFDSAL